MAKVVIILTDQGDNNVHADVTIDPELKKGDRPTPAQSAGMALLEGLRYMGQELGKKAARPKIVIPHTRKKKR